jgi:hypothetical protein
VKHKVDVVIERGMTISGVWVWRRWEERRTSRVRGRCKRRVSRVVRKKRYDGWENCGSQYQSGNAYFDSCHLRNRTDEDYTFDTCP